MFRRADSATVAVAGEERLGKMTGLLHDLRYGLRILVRSPAYTAVAVLSLALGIGANTAVFSVVHSVLMKPLPYDDPDRLVQLLGKLPIPGRDWKGRRVGRQLRRIGGRRTESLRTSRSTRTAP